MSYIKNDDLIRRIVTRAMDDRVAFLDAVRNNPAMVEETQREIAQISALKGLSLKGALDADKEGVRIACIYAEQYWDGLADAPVGREALNAKSMFKIVRAFRKKRFGATQLESRIAEMKSVPILEFLKMHNQNSLVAK